MLELILEQTGDTRQGEVSTPVAPASIFVSAPVDNALRMELELASRQRPGSLELGLFQGNRPNSRNDTGIDAKNGRTQPADPLSPWLSVCLIPPSLLLSSNHQNFYLPRPEVMLWLVSVKDRGLLP